MYNYFATNNQKLICCIFPDKCPVCGKFISPNKLYSHHESKSDTVSVVFECPSCKKTFISQYINKKIQAGHESKTYIQFELSTSFPKNLIKVNFSEQIEKLSPTFIEIYNQSYASEFHELNQLSGMGYRKALEFLIKDYCIYKHPDKEQEIKDTMLSHVIKTYISDNKISNLATASTWLGNDETHYTRKHEDKDINDLKAFINTVVAYINYELIAEEAEQLVNS